MERMRKGKKNLTFDLVRELLHQEEEKNKKLKEENEYRKKIADVLPEGEGHIAEETIQDLQKEIKNLKLIQETNEKQIQNDIKERDELREENKKLKSDYDRLDKVASENIRTLDELEAERIELEEENKKLKEENISLHLEIEDLKEEYGNLDY